MPIPSAIITTAATLMNNSSQSVYTNAVCLPYLNLAMQILQEIYELNDIPITHATSAAIPIAAGIKRLGPDTNPSLPTDFVELSQLWESPAGQEQWSPVDKRDFIPHYLQNQTTISQFLLYSWQKGGINLIPANSNNDLKLDYIAKLFIPVTTSTLNINIPIQGVETYLEFMTAALCAFFIAENESRSAALNKLADDALGRALGIPIKGQQSILTRRLPFRYNMKARRMVL